MKIFRQFIRIIVGYIKPSGTEPLNASLVEAEKSKKVHSLSSEITNKLILEINKIVNE